MSDCSAMVCDDVQDRSQFALSNVKENRNDSVNMSLLCQLQNHNMFTNSCLRWVLSAEFTPTDKIR